MAEIRVEQKRGGLGWLWALLLVLLVALAAWWFLTTRNADGPAAPDPAAEVTPASPTSGPAMPNHRPAAAMVFRRA